MRAHYLFMNFIALVIGVSVSASACTLPIDKNYDEMLTADGIFVGEMVAYEPTGFNDNGNASQALVTYRVDEVLKGQIANQIEVSFPPINYRVPDSRDPQGPEIVSFWQHQYKDGLGNPLTSNLVIGGPVWESMFWMEEGRTSMP